MLYIEKWSSNCEIEKYFSVIIEQLIESDIYYLLDFKKEEVPKGSIFYFNEIISIDSNSIEDDSLMKIDMEKLNTGTNSNQYNYVCFNTGLSGNKISFLVMFYREDYLTNQNTKSKFLKYKRSNIGVLYSFELDESGCLKGYTKKVVNFG